ncbi:MAG: hypothetical protein P1U75_14420 [Antarcticimicrobium sp.]|uniref:hypothetical protein n=1 Tax=Antarcticimicrobium sp. TaxID=2824147 RepID=UPI002631A7AB|nr:hypothetical protein [Antarcticimicrobium sp.]MDF1717847.1 hypothetical protein [Antarcticimicrobium sp.]
MANISAFVGHSFLPEDEAVVRKFTDFFDELSRSHEFDWVHATEPRPDDVAFKVLDLIDGRNLFIGICTPNERVAKENSFARTIFGNFWKIKKDELQAKTSDWIIQEIGLAIGRKMKIIILLQGGVRKPGSLQGNIEYIPFDRDAVEKSFSSILGMVTSLQGSGVSAARSSRLQNEGTASGEDHEEPLGHDAEEPNDEWNEKKFDFEYFKAVIFKDAERAEIVSDAWLKRVGADKEIVAIWTTSCLLMKTQFTEENHLSEINSISNNYPENSKIQMNLARAYEHFEDYNRAREKYQASLEISVENSEKRIALSALARICQSIGDISGVETAINELRSLVETSEDEKDLLSTIEKLASWHGESKILKLAIMERELEIDPTDMQKRFQLAYAHSESDNNSLTMYHYEKIPGEKRDHITWNNLGVVYQGFSLPGLSVSAYKTAANQGETLAMSNLAEMLMSAGFLKEAEGELQRAKEIDGAHKNVAKSQVRLDSIPADEEEERVKKLGGAPELSKFLSEVGHQVWQATPSTMGDTWVDEEVTLFVNKAADRVTAKGSFQRTQSGNGLGTALIGKDDKTVETFDVTVSGRLMGSVLVGHYQTDRQRNSLKPAGLLDSFPNKKDFIAVYDNERQVLRCTIDKELKELAVKTLAEVPQSEDGK